jgi:hypothetical protein
MDKLYHVRLAFLQPVELNGYIESFSEEKARENIMEKGKEQGHIDIRILSMEEVIRPDPEAETVDQEPKVIN